MDWKGSRVQGGHTVLWPLEWHVGGGLAWDGIAQLEEKEACGTRQEDEESATRFAIQVKRKEGREEGWDGGKGKGMEEGRKGGREAGWE
jgi:flagellar biosynthesis/type III secretory pathway protein FliH